MAPLFRFGLLFLLLGAEMVTVVPCGVDNGLVPLLEILGQESRFADREAFWSRVGREGEYKGSGEQNSFLERAILTNLDYLSIPYPPLKELLRLLDESTDFSHRGVLYAHYVSRMENYRGTAAQNNALRDALVEGISSIRPLRTQVKEESFLSRGGLPTENGARSRLWAAQFPSEMWEGTEEQEERLLNRMSLRWEERVVDKTDLVDVLTYLGFSTQSLTKRSLWDWHARGIFKQRSYRRSNRNDRRLLDWILVDYAVGEARMGQVALSTAYNPLPEQTDSTPDITATSKRVREGYVAVSRDLEERFPMGSMMEVLLVCEIDTNDECLSHGEIGEVYVVEVQDRMHRRKRNQVDFFLMCRDDALLYGRRRVIITSIGN